MSTEILQSCQAHCLKVEAFVSQNKNKGDKLSHSFLILRTCHPDIWFIVPDGLRSLFMVVWKSQSHHICDHLISETMHLVSNTARRSEQIVLLQIYALLSSLWFKFEDFFPFSAAVIFLLTYLKYIVSDMFKTMNISECSVSLTLISYFHQNIVYTFIYIVNTLY